MGSQLPLGFKLDGGFRLENFFAGPNESAVQDLIRAVEERAGTSLLLQGGVGVGKTHLLQALCGEATARGERVAYLPLRLAGEEFKPDALQGLEKVQSVFLDDLDAIAGRPAWERELVERLRLRQSGQWSLVLSSTRPPREIGFELTALRDYARRGRALPLLALEGDDRIWALQRHAACRGIKLAEDVALQGPDPIVSFQRQ